MLDPRGAATFDQEVAATAQTHKDEFACADPDLRVDVHDHPRTDTSRPASATSAVAWLGILIPNGVVSLVTPGIVESSNNLGTLRLDDDGIHLMTTITAGVTSSKHHIAEQITALADLVGGTASEFGLDAPEFPYNAESELLRRAREAYTDVIGTEPTTLVSNCSLELGMFTNRLPGLDTISIGTNLSGLHSPAERVSHRSIARVWPVVKTLMGKLDS